MATYRQINYIKTMARQASRKTQEELENVLLNTATPPQVTQYWIERLAKEVDIKK